MAKKPTADRKYKERPGYTLSGEPPRWRKDGSGSSPSSSSKSKVGGGNDGPLDRWPAAPTKTKLVWNKDAFNQLRTGPALRDMMEKMGEHVVERFGPEGANFEVSETRGKRGKRALRVGIWMTNIEAAKRETRGREFTEAYYSIRWS